MIFHFSVGQQCSWCFWHIHLLFISLPTWAKMFNQITKKHLIFQSNPIHLWIGSHACHAAVSSLHFFLSLNNSVSMTSATVNDLLWSASSIFSFQRLLGLPTGLLVFGFHSYHIFGILSSSILYRWPYHLNWPFSTIVVTASILISLLCQHFSACPFSSHPQWVSALSSLQLPPCFWSFVSVSSFHSHSKGWA